MTTRSADHRAYEIYTGSTGVPAPFEVEYTAPVSNCRAAERAIHEELNDCRFSDGREFFQLPIETAKNCIDTVVAEVNVKYGEPSIPQIDAENWIALSPDDRSTGTQYTETTNPRSEQDGRSNYYTKSKFARWSIEDWIVFVVIFGIGVVGNFVIAISAFRSDEFFSVGLVFTAMGFIALMVGLNHFRGR